MIDIIKSVHHCQYQLRTMIAPVRLASIAVCWFVVASVLVGQTASVYNASTAQCNSILEHCLQSVSDRHERSRLEFGVRMRVQSDHLRRAAADNRVLQTWTTFDQPAPLCTYGLQVARTNWQNIRERVLANAARCEADWRRAVGAWWQSRAKRSHPLTQLYHDRLLSSWSVGQLRLIGDQLDTAMGDMMDEADRHAEFIQHAHGGSSDATQPRSMCRRRVTDVIEAVCWLAQEADVNVWSFSGTLIDMWTRRVRALYVAADMLMES